MIKTLKKGLTIGVLMAVILGLIACNRATTPGNGEIRFAGGYPTEETAKTLYDEFDYQAAVQAYVWSTSLLNSMGFWTALQRDLGFRPGELAVAVFDKRMQPQDVVMTANTEVVYCWSQYVNIAETGPLVIEAPAGVRGHIWDLWQRALEDIGDVGPDQGRGGKFLVLPREFAGEVPAGYFPVRLIHSDHALFVMRVFVTAEGGGLPGAVALAQTIRAYPLANRSAPEPNRFVLVGDKPFNSDWPKDERYFELLAQAINLDSVPEAGLAILGNLRRLGIEKGQPFNPDDRARAILVRAAETGYAIVRAMAFDNRFATKLVYSDRRWERPLYNTDSQFLLPHYEEVEERAASWYQIIGNFAHAEHPTPGTGQFPMIAYRDAGGEYLNGSNTYRLDLPADVPVAQFWQVPIYDVETRSLINTDQKRASLSGKDDLILNPDRSVTLYFGPQPPQGMEKNWIRTIPGQGWFTMLRLYGPLQPVLDKSWKPNDIERTK